MTQHGTVPRSAMAEEEDVDAPAPPLTRAQAEALRAQWPKLSPAYVVGVQAAVGLLMCVLTWWVTARQEAVWSALYGAGLVVLPGALMAQGLRRVLQAGAGAATFGFMFWEFVKIGMTVGLLGLAVKIVPDLSWPALLLTMIVCMKMNWLALLLRGRVKKIRS